MPKNGNITTVQYDVKNLIFAEYNPRELTQDQHQDLKDSITRFGFVDPLIVNTHKERKNILVGGHQRLKIAKELGYKDVPCVEVDLTPDKEKELNVRLNKNTGQWDWDALANHFDVGELLEWGFSEDELQFTEPEEVQGLIDDDDVPEVEESITKQGDLWILGEHRLLCGDATKKEDVERLMDGQKADMVFTDPPYGIGYEYNSHKDKDGESNKNLVTNVFSNFDCGKVWTCGLMNLERDISRFGKAKVLVWWKKFAMAGNGLGGASTWEPILVINPINKKLKNDVFEISTDREEGLREKHSCPKPVQLYVDLINGLSYKESNCIDPFLGSGTTLIACTKTNRKCYGMEIDPHYCDVIVKRWEDYTGNKAERFEAANA